MKPFYKLVLFALVVSFLVFSLAPSALADEDPYLDLTDGSGVSGTAVPLTTFQTGTPNMDHLFTYSSLITSLQVTATPAAGKSFAGVSTSYVCNSAAMPSGHGSLLGSCYQVSFSSTEVVFQWTGLNIAAGTVFDFVTGPTNDLSTIYWPDRTNFSVAVNNVPEPASIFLIGTGLLAVAGTLRRKLNR